MFSPSPEAITLQPLASIIGYVKRSSCLTASSIGVSYRPLVVFYLELVVSLNGGTVTLSDAAVNVSHVSNDAL